MHFFTVEQLRNAQAIGAVEEVTLRAEGSSFQVLVETARGTSALVKSRKVEDDFEVRRFSNPAKAFLLLHELGIMEARIDGKSWTPNAEPADRRTRPDRSVVLKAAHEALSHTDWLQKKVQASRDGLANGTNRKIESDEWAKIRAAKRAQHKIG